MVAILNEPLPELLLESPEDDELPPRKLELQLKLELEPLTISLLLLLPAPQAATARHEIAANRLSARVEWLEQSVLIQAAMCSKHCYSVNIARAKMSRSRDGAFQTTVTLGRKRARRRRRLVDDAPMHPSFSNL